MLYSIAEVKDCSVPARDYFRFSYEDRRLSYCSHHRRLSSDLFVSFPCRLHATLSANARRLSCGMVSTTPWVALAKWHEGSAAFAMSWVWSFSSSLRWMRCGKQGTILGAYCCHCRCRRRCRCRCCFRSLIGCSSMLSSLFL